MHKIITFNFTLILEMSL